MRCHYGAMAAAPMYRGSKPFEHKVSIVGMGSYEEAPSNRSIFVNTQLLIATDDNCQPPNAIYMAYTMIGLYFNFSKTRHLNPKSRHIDPRSCHRNMRFISI